MAYDYDFTDRTAAYSSPEDVAADLHKLWPEWVAMCKRVHDARMFYEKLAKTHPKGSKPRLEIEMMTTRLINMERGKGSVNQDTHSSELRTIGYAADDVVAEIAGISVIDRARARR